MFRATILGFVNVSETALTVLDLARAGRFAGIREMFAPQLRAMVPAEALEAAWAAEIGRHGQVTAVGVPVTGPAQAGTVDVKFP